MPRLLVAIARGVSASLPACQLTFRDREPIDVERARAQHAAYVEALRAAGYAVTVLPAEDDMPDAVFVEDPILVLDECAVVMSLGSEERRREIPSLAAAVERHRPLVRLQPPALVDAGDVVRVGRSLFVGISKRTNLAGVAGLRRLVAPLGYDVIPVEMGDCLHLKSGCTNVGRHLLIHEPWVDSAPFGNLPLLRVPPPEPHGANALALWDRLLVSAGCPETDALLREEGYRTTALELSELEKAEAAVTCMSLIL